MNFRYQALKGGAVVTDAVEAETLRAAADELRRRGLTVLRVEAQAAERAAVQQLTGFVTRRTGPRDLLLLSRQLRMLTESGSAIVPALEAIEQQATRPAIRAIVRSMRERLEGGASLSAALADHPGLFRPEHRAIVAVGEATGALPASFERLAELAEREQRMRANLTSALAYPAALAVMCVAVIFVMILFVVPRFKLLFTSLHTPLPVSTQFMLAMSDALQQHWIFATLAGVGLIAGGVFALRQSHVRQAAAATLLRVPIFGPLLRRIAAARLLRIWGTLLSASVPLIDALRQSHAALNTGVLRDAVERITAEVAGGARLGDEIAKAGWFEPVIVAAIRTGEENSRLAEALLFVAGWMDDDNARSVATLTRLVEPTMLAIMGAVVGVVAMSLFLPLFDMASAGG